MTTASPPDLSKLRIDRSLAPIRRSRRRKWVWLGVLAVLIVGAAASGMRCSRASLDRADDAGGDRRIRRSSSSC